MSELKYPESSYNWANKKGLVYTCAIHRIRYDTYVGCPECRERQREEERKKNKKDLFKNVIWM